MENFVKLWRENRKCCELRPDMTAAELSKAVGFPVVILYMDQIDEQPLAPGRSPTNIPLRAERIQTKLIESVSSPPIIRTYSNLLAGSVAADTIASCATLDAHNLRDEDGAHVTRGAVLFLEDRRLTREQLWSVQTGLEIEQIENLLPHHLVEWTFVHEAQHLTQRSANLAQPPAEQWVHEVDADRAAYHWLLKNGDDETLTAYRHARALNGFLKSDDYYWNALAFDAHERKAAIPDYETCRKAGFELRKRCFHRVRGEFQHEFKAVAAEDVADAISALNKKWGVWNDPSDTLPALREILKAGEITNPWARRNAELVMEAAQYFCPTLANGPENSLLPRPVAAPAALTSLAPVSPRAARLK